MAGEDDTFEVYQDKKGEYRWRRTASNGRQVGRSTEGYKKKADAEKNMKRGAKDSDTLEIYKDKKGEYRWRRTASNGQVVGASSEGYVKKSACQANADRLS